MYRSIAVDGRSAAATFLRRLQEELVRFGRDDTSLVNLGDLTILVWTPNFKAVGSQALRQASLKHRLLGQKARLQVAEARLPPTFFDPFDIDFAAIDPEIVIVRKGNPEDALFDYAVQGQSIVAETTKMRLGKFVVYDRSRTPKRLMGILALKSPMYFDGARDRHLGWPRVTDFVGGVQVKNSAAIAFRNLALKSVYNLCVCMPVAPYDQSRVGKLLASLAFSPTVIDHLEATYGSPVLGITTTGGWGGSAGQYERIRLAAPVVKGQKAKLYVRTHGVKLSLNYPHHLFSDDLYVAALETMRASVLPARAYTTYASHPVVARSLLRAASHVVGLPKAATATNAVAHYFGSSSEACRLTLADIAGLANPPPSRSIPVAEALADWRSQPLPPPVKGAVATALSASAT